jgi:hypothetical protein
MIDRAANRSIPSKTTPSIVAASIFVVPRSRIEELICQHEKQFGFFGAWRIVPLQDFLSRQHFSLPHLSLGVRDVRQWRKQENSPGQS